MKCKYGNVYVHTRQSCFYQLAKAVDLRARLAWDETRGCEELEAIDGMRSQVINRMAEEINTPGVAYAKAAVTFLLQEIMDSAVLR